MHLITIVCDGSPDIDGAIDVLYPFIKTRCVSSFRPAAAMGQAIEASVSPVCRPEIVKALNAAGYRIVEGGQQ